MIGVERKAVVAVVLDDINLRVVPAFMHSYQVFLWDWHLKGYNNLFHAIGFCLYGFWLMFSAGIKEDQWLKIGETD